jgi:hypothetical protein
MKANNLKNGYNHNDWLLLIDDIINFLIVFSSIIDLSIWAVFGLKVASFIAFLMLMMIGLGKTIIGMINFFHK